MENGKTKEQHYIPRFYLKNFANQEKKFTLINIEKKKAIIDIPYLPQFKEKYFYDKDNSIENKLSILEAKWANTINSILDGHYPSEKEKNNLKEFAIYQRNRTLYKSDELLEFSWQSERIKQEMEYHRKRVKVDDEQWEEIKRKFIKKYPYKSISIALKIAERNLNILDDLDVAIIKYNTREKLISSDNPIIHYNNFDQKSVGYINAGLVIFFSLSSEYLCVIYDSKMYEKLNNDDYIHSNNEYEVKYLNYFQILNSYNYIYFNNSMQAQTLIKMLKKQKIQKLLCLPKFKSDLLGNDNEKLLSFSAKYVYLNHSFSFSRLVRRAIRVPKNAIDWFPRKFDKKYYNGNFKNRVSIIPVLNKMKNDNNFKEAVIWNEEEIKIFNKFIIDYWGNSL